VAMIEQGTKQLLTHSRMSAYKTCRKQAWFSYELGLRREVDAKALRMGAAGHDALHAAKSGRDVEGALNAVDQSYDAIPEQCSYTEWNLEREIVRKLIEGYLWRWGESTIKYLETEFPFTIELLNPSTKRPSSIFDLAGKIDGIVELEDTRLAVMEHKFLSESLASDSPLWQRLQMDQQISLYVIAARRYGYVVESVLYDVIHKPSIRPQNIPLVDECGDKIVLDSAGQRVLTKQGKPRQTGDAALGYILQTRSETVEEYGQRLMQDIYTRPEFYYARVEIARLDDTLAEFESELWEVQKTIRDSQNQNRWFRTVGKHTCDFCAYFSLCNSGYNPDGFIPDGFVKVENVHQELEE
jgi:CRISPR/Cas system-associated exonuclease Cas4 (RecB family)